jgi:hypothetical protein
MAAIAAAAAAVAAGVNPKAKKYRPSRIRTSYRGSTVPDPFPAFTYLQTPEQNIQPVCIVCPNFIKHQNGYCRLGEELCYSALALGLQNHFEEGMEEPLPTENFLLEE